jgi:hypothetical protein
MTEFAEGGRASDRLFYFLAPWSCAALSFAIIMVGHYSMGREIWMIFTEMKPEWLRAQGISIKVGNLPEVPPCRDGHTLYALITNGSSKEFVIEAGDPFRYSTYRRMTQHPGDQGNWFFRTMELFFVPREPVTQNT